MTYQGKWSLIWVKGFGVQPLVSHFLLYRTPAGHRWPESRPFRDETGSCAKVMLNTSGTFVMVATGPRVSSEAYNAFKPLSCFSSNFQSQCSGLQWFNDGVNELSQPAPSWMRAFWLKRCGWIKLQKVRHTHNCGRETVDAYETAACVNQNAATKWKLWVELVHGIISIILFAFLFYPFLQFIPIHFPETLLSNQQNQGFLFGGQWPLGKHPIGTSCQKEDGGRPFVGQIWSRN